MWANFVSIDAWLKSFPYGYHTNLFSISITKTQNQDEGVSNIMIMGDMNAGGSSAPIAIMNSVESELPNFKWLIGEEI